MPFDPDPLPPEPPPDPAGWSPEPPADFRPMFPGLAASGVAAGGMALASCVPTPAHLAALIAQTESAREMAEQNRLKMVAIRERFELGAVMLAEKAPEPWEAGREMHELATTFLGDQAETNRYMALQQGVIVQLHGIIGSLLGDLGRLSAIVHAPFDLSAYGGSSGGVGPDGDGSGDRP